MIKESCSNTSAHSVESPKYFSHEASSEREGQKSFSSPSKKKEHNSIGKLKPLSPEKFYSPQVDENWKRKLKQIRGEISNQSETTKQKTKTEPSTHKSELFWFEFPKQKLAFECADEYSFPTVLFCYEKMFQEKSTRRYLVSTIESFWSYYSTLPINERHFYEILRDKKPAHLYFDLEFPLEENPNRNGEEMVEHFIQFVGTFLQKNFQLNLPSNIRKYVIDLASNSPEKFSRHLIFRLPRACFKDTTHCHAFVLEMVDEISQLRLQDPFYDQFFVKNNEKETFFADLGVYSKNRNFRVYLSSKINKKIPLVPSSSNQYPFHDEKQFFIDSLIGYIPYHENMTLLEMNIEKLTPLKRKRNAASVLSPSKPKGQESNKMEDEIFGEFQSSPFPQIDDFIKKEIDAYGQVPCQIRSWVFFPQSGTILFNVSHNRYCHNIGRQHKSNHVFYVVDLFQKIYFQKCYDPDCRAIDYRSPEQKIPDHLIPESIRDILLQKKIDQDPSFLPDSVISTIDVDHSFSKSDT